MRAVRKFPLVKLASSVGFFAGRFPRASILVVCLSFIAGLAESVGLLALLPLFEMITSRQEGATSVAPVSSYLIRLFSNLHIPWSTFTVLGSIFLFILAKAALSFIAAKQVDDLASRMARELRSQLYGAILKARWGFFTTCPIGHVINSVATEIPHATAAYRSALELVTRFIQISLLVAAAFFIHPEVAAASLLAGLMMASVLNGFIRLARAASRHNADHTRSLLARLTDSLQGIKPIKSMHAERFLIPMLERENDAIHAAERRTNTAKNGLAVLHEPVIALVVVLGMYCALEIFHLNLPDLITMTVLFYRTAGNIGKFQSIAQMLATSEVYYHNILDLIASAHRQQERAMSAVPTLRAPTQTYFQDRIEFAGVSFAYGARPILNKLDWSLNFGEFVTIYGPSGSGKTTMVELLCGLNRPTTGRLMIDGIPIDQLDMARWRCLIGYVPQDLFLFHDTILKNITLGDHSLTEQQVTTALGRAGALEFVNQLPHGLNSMIGERGLQLSGGQRQRLVIARALVREPRLLILDEATASLDQATEQGVIATLHALSGSVTILAVSHQQTMMNASHRSYYFQAGQLNAQAV